MILTHCVQSLSRPGSADGLVFPMATIVRLPLENRSGDPWPQIVGVVRDFADARGLALRDAIVLAPFAQHLPLARRAWSALGGWMPRIETTFTLARSLAPRAFAQGDDISFDAALDRLTARRLLRAQPFGQAWLRRDERGFDHAVNAVVQTAQAFARAAAAMPPDARAGHWAKGRELLSIAAGPGGTERMLGRIALEWAAASAEPATDGLFGLQPTAWIIVQAGGADPLAQAVLAASPQVPSLVVDADPAIDTALRDLAPNADVAIALCADFEAEAQRSAAEVIARLNESCEPVALISQDRLLTRRVRALLARQRVLIDDETGWKLSTTRAGASIGTLLRAAAPRASADDWLDWLKTCAAHWPGVPHGASALQRIESAMRRRGWTSPAMVDIADLGESSARLWNGARDVIGDLRASRQRSFPAWLAALHDALHACGAWDALLDDDAGRQAVAALHLEQPAIGRGDAADAMTLQEFTHWADDTLEDASFVPASPPASGPAAQVIVTPLASAILRPFGAVVFAGVDEKRLGAMPRPHPLLGDSQATALGLPTIAARRDAEFLAFAHLLRQPNITLLRRLDDGGEALAPSTLVERLQLAMRSAGRDLPEASDPYTPVELQPRPVSRTAPSAPDLIPDRLSASACEALRACPYRFFALRMLSLNEADELEDVIEKRDYGTWLHDVLHRFHLTRTQAVSAAEEETRLHAVAREAQAAMRLDDADFLPFAATFARFVPRYLTWLHERDRQGANWLDGERDFTANPASWGGVQMRGRIDRIDSVPSDEGPVTQLIDYKTGSAQKLRDQVKHPQEDTQLAFYAALVIEQSDAGGNVGAVYLPLDDAQGIKAIEHKGVEATARALVAGIGRDLARLRNGAPMPALGEGDACSFCEARGLCRRDHWRQDEDA